MFHQDKSGWPFFLSRAQWRSWPNQYIFRMDFSTYFSRFFFFLHQFCFLRLFLCRVIQQSILFKKHSFSVLLINWSSTTFLIRAAASARYLLNRKQNIPYFHNEAEHKKKGGSHFVTLYTREGEEEENPLHDAELAHVHKKCMVSDHPQEVVEASFVKLSASPGFKNKARLGYAMHLNIE